MSELLALAGIILAIAGFWLGSRRFSGRAQVARPETLLHPCYGRAENLPHVEQILDNHGTGRCLFCSTKIRNLPL